jgi:hypothetical protein
MKNYQRRLFSPLQGYFVSAIAAVIFLSTNVQAAQVTVTGDRFTIVYDNAASSLLGAPSIVGNFITFSPTDFFAEQVNAGIDFSRATFNFKLNLLPNSQLDAVRFVNSGDYWSMGSGSNVNAAGQLRVFDMANPLLNNSISQLASNTSLGQRDTAGTVNWSNSALIDLRAPQWNTSTSLSITIENLLMGYNTSAGLLSFIEQKFTAIELDVVAGTGVPPVPEPAHWASIIVGLLVVSRVVQKRNSASVV